MDDFDDGLQALLPEANRRDRLRAEVESLGEATVIADRPPLFGALVAVKDIIHVDGFATRAGSQLPAEVLTGPEGGCVQSLRDAGALILGKAVTTEFACFKSGPTRNPHNPAHSPGGSSSGSAAAVAAGYCPLALGSQTIGSVIRPAAFCGIVGFKPSYGRIDMTGFIHCSPSVDTIGLFTQDAAGMELAAAVICRDWRTGADGPDRPVLGVPVGADLEQTEPRSMDDFRRQLEHLRTRGYTVLEIAVLSDIGEINHRHRTMMAAEMAQVHDREAWYERFSAVYDPATSHLIEQGREVSPADLEAGRLGRACLREQMEREMAVSGIDLWACPAATGPAPRAWRPPAIRR